MTDWLVACRHQKKLFTTDPILPRDSKVPKVGCKSINSWKNYFCFKANFFIVGMWQVEKWVERSSDSFDQCRVLWSFWAIWAVVVAQLVEWLLPTPEICSFEPCHWQKFLYQFIYQLYNRKDENKEKDAKNGPPFKNFLSGKSGRWKFTPVCLKFLKNWFQINQIPKSDFFNAC